MPWTGECPGRFQDRASHVSRPRLLLHKHLPHVVCHWWRISYQSVSLSNLLSLFPDRFLTGGPKAPVSPPFLYVTLPPTPLPSLLGWWGRDPNTRPPLWSPDPKPVDSGEWRRSAKLDGSGKPPFPEGYSTIVLKSGQGSSNVPLYLSF